MSFDSHGLFDLLPAILRIRDSALAAVTPGWLAAAERVALADLTAKVANGIALSPSEQQQLVLLQRSAMAGPLASLLAVVAEQVAVLGEDIEQLYDDAFVETCADWIVPYIGDLIGYRALHGVAAKVASPRAEVAHTIAYRRRKGTVSVLEQLARDVTGWDAKAVEFFQHLVMTQYMNHLRPRCLAAPDLRAFEPLERLGTAFDSIAHTIDVRRIASGRGRYNIPNVGVFLWRVSAYPLTRSPAARIDARRWRFHPLGIDQQLYTLPQTEDRLTQLATPLNVPAPISRRVLAAHFADYYTGTDGATKSLRIYENSSGDFEPVDPTAITVCNLADAGAGWAHMPGNGIYAIDPVLGRIALPADAAAGTAVQVDFHYGFSADIGGGEYERASSYESVQTPPQLLQVPGDHPTIQAALTALGGAGVVEITDSGRYEETLHIDAAAGQRVELRAANGHRPTLVLGGELTLTGAADSEIRLNGLLIAANRLHVPASSNALHALQLSHCTLVPGWTLENDLTPVSAAEPSLVIELAEVAVTIARCILGGLRMDVSATVSASDSIIDATATTGVAYAAPDDIGAGGALRLDACTVIGKVHALMLPLVSNSILLGELASGDPWSAPIVAVRRQEGCVRFSYLPESARVPRRYQCLPETAPSPEQAAPRFTSLRYGFPAYAQLSLSAGARLLSGADDEGQPAAFHSLYQPQRETNLRVRLDEYLRVGLEAGIFYQS
jgi:hypothetical protein